MFLFYISIETVRRLTASKDFLTTQAAKPSGESAVLASQR